MRFELDRLDPPELPLPRRLRFVFLSAIPIPLPGNGLYTRLPNPDGSKRSNQRRSRRYAATPAAVPTTDAAANDRTGEGRPPPSRCATAFLIAFITNEFPENAPSCVALRPGLNRDARFTGSQIASSGTALAQR